MMALKAHGATPNDSSLRPHAEVAPRLRAETLRRAAATRVLEPAHARSLVLLCTDLADFTSTVERLGDDRARVLMRVHNRLLRTCIEQHVGHEVTHTGDGILASFGSTDAALDCALEIRARLAKHNELHPDTLLRARIGVHAGNPLREDGRLFGSAVNVTVRVCAAARPEQILVTSEVRDGAVQLESAFRICGTFTLKGLPAPRTLHELRAP